MDQARKYYENRRAAKPKNDWGRWLLTVGVDVGAGVQKFNATERAGRISLWSGWQKYMDEIERLEKCGFYSPAPTPTPVPPTPTPVPPTPTPVPVPPTPTPTPVPQQS